MLNHIFFNLIFQIIMWKCKFAVYLVYIWTLICLPVSQVFCAQVHRWFSENMYLNFYNILQICSWVNHKTLQYSIAAYFHSYFFFLANYNIHQLNLR